MTCGVKNDEADDTGKKVGNRIKELREYQGMSQTDLGGTCEKDGKYISRKEAGKESIQVDNLEKIVTGLNVKGLKDFFDFDNIPHYLVKKKKKRKNKKKQ